MTHSPLLAQAGSLMVTNRQCDISAARTGVAHVIARNDVTDSVYDRLYETGCGRYMVVEDSYSALHRFDKCSDGCFPQ